MMYSFLREKEERLRALPPGCGLLGLRLDRELHVQLSTDPEAFRLPVLAGPDPDPAFAVDLAVGDWEQFVGGACLFCGFCVFSCHGLSPFCKCPFGRAPERPEAGAASTGKLGGTFRGNRSFLFTRGAIADGKGLEHARRGLRG